MYDVLHLIPATIRGVLLVVVDRAVANEMGDFVLILLDGVIVAVAVVGAGVVGGAARGRGVPRVVKLCVLELGAVHGGWWWWWRCRGSRRSG
jgi:hypothetical protein